MVYSLHLIIQASKEQQEKSCQKNYQTTIETIRIKDEKTKGSFLVTFFFFFSLLPLIYFHKKQKSI